jgi:hypothetical protein
MTILKTAIACTLSGFLVASQLSPAAAGPMPTNIATMKSMVADGPIQVHWRGGWGGGWALERVYSPAHSLAAPSRPARTHITALMARRITMEIRIRNTATTIHAPPTMATGHTTATGRITAPMVITGPIACTTIIAGIAVGE